MKQTKHTPGPWKIVPSRFGFLVTANDKSLCQVSALDGHDTEEGDARLIACAPELLSALERLQNHSELGIYVQDWIGTIIRKAKGG